MMTPPRQEPTTQDWVPVCDLTDLDPERGAAALVKGAQIAVIRLADDTVVAVQHLDPVSGAHVLARGIVGTRDGRTTLTSPVYKQIYDLHTGECLEAVGATPQTLRRWQVMVENGRVSIGATIGALTGDRAGAARAVPLGVGT